MDAQSLRFPKEELISTKGYVRKWIDEGSQASLSSLEKELAVLRGHTRKPGFKRKPEIVELLAIGATLQSMLKEVPETLLVRMYSDTRSNLSIPEQLDRAKTYKQITELIDSSVNSFTSAPNAFIAHIKAQLGRNAIVAGGLASFIGWLLTCAAGGAAKLHCAVNACCGGGIAAASFTALFQYIVLPGVLGAVCYVVVVALYRHFTAPEVHTREAAVLRERLKQLSVDGEAATDYNTLVSLMQDLEVFCTVPGINVHGQSPECIICTTEFHTCVCSSGAPHQSTCAVSAFECSHVLCKHCASDPRVVLCPLCRSVRRQRTM